MKLFYVVKSLMKYKPVYFPVKAWTILQFLI